VSEEPSQQPLAVVCLTPQAGAAAAFLAERLGAELHVHVLVRNCPEANPFERIAGRLAELWPQVRGLVVFAPAGVVVRSIAPLLEHKTRDPGVVVVDALARWAIPLVGGHEGGANRLSEQVANLLGSEPIVTTASEAVRDLVVGLGCRRGVPAGEVVAAIEAALATLGLPRTRVRCLATASPKRDESGLRGAAAALGLPLLVVHDLEIRSRRRLRRTAAARHVGLVAVSQPAALSAGRRTQCLLKRFRHGRVMVAIAQECSEWWDSDPATPNTEPRRP
jgi:cobalt-precorrin 5A hydrolase